MPRIVSLIASATEIVAALGCGPSLVGRSHECDYPDFVRKLPVCTAPKIATGAPSGAIDRSVKELLRDALSIYTVDADLLRRLRPDVLVTQTQCEVCAVSLKDVEAALCEWTDSRPTIVPLEPNGLNDVWRDIQRVADALRVSPAGVEPGDGLRRRMAHITESVRALPDRPTVACIEWIDPLMASGNWMPDLVQMAGGENLFGEPGKHAPGMSFDQLLDRQPDVVCILPCGFDIARTRKELGPLTGRPDWRELRAVREGTVYLLDGNQYFNRPGPRLLESLEILAEILHPEAGLAVHEGTGWVHLDRR